MPVRIVLDLCDAVAVRLRGLDGDLGLALLVMAWIGGVLVLASLSFDAEPARQVVLAAATWGLLIALLRRESPLVRTQTALVVLMATAVEYTFSPLLEAYVYRIGTVPGFVPPGHGLVYLAALALGRSGPAARHPRAIVATVVVLASGWAIWGLASPRHDVLGAFWWACLLAFLRWGPNPLLYAGAFVVVGYLEIVGTALGVWRWQVTDPVLHLIGQGNPPSGAAGGYGWFDLWATLLAPRVLEVLGVLGVLGRFQGRRAARTSSCSSELVATALPPNGPSSPSSEVNRPPASTTIGTSAAMSYSSSSGSQATSTAPSATSMYDQKSP